MWSNIASSVRLSTICESFSWGICDVRGILPYPRQDQHLMHWIFQAHFIPMEFESIARLCIPLNLYSVHNKHVWFIFSCHGIICWLGCFWQWTAITPCTCRDIPYDNDGVLLTGTLPSELGILTNLQSLWVKTGPLVSSFAQEMLH